jgi:hypothetical protein
LLILFNNKNPTRGFDVNSVVQLKQIFVNHEFCINNDWPLENVREINENCLKQEIYLSMWKLGQNEGDCRNI